MKDNYRTANTFPDLEIKPFPTLMQILIPACWSAEFDHHIVEIRASSLLFYEYFSHILPYFPFIFDY